MFARRCGIGGMPPRCGILLTAFFIDFGTFHRHHHSDSLIPVLESLYHWQIFFWSQDRFGMLVPLLATPFSILWPT